MGVKMEEFDLGIGPMSSEVIEAVYRYSHFNGNGLMLISSKNQVDYSGGYVNNWKTKDFVKYLSKMSSIYPKSNVIVCRDHCGPGFNGIYDLKDTYSTIRDDIENGFDLIHIDFSKFPGSKTDILEESKKAINYAMSINPKIKLEIGTDENRGDFYNKGTIPKIEQEIDFFKSFCHPDFYVVQTGSLIKEINQVGEFNPPFVKDISFILKQKGLKLKEHNADYLSKDEISLRRGVVNAMNIAPQLGTVQTQKTLESCLIHGISFEDFTNEAYSRKKWEKWLQENTPKNKFLCSLIAGHYHFSSKNYKKILNELSKSINIKEEIISSLMEVIKHYEENR